MNKEKIKDILTIGISVFMLVVVIGISYSAFTYSGLGKKENKITTGAITMLYTESSNTITMNNALPTTDNTGKTRKTVGEYFDFTVKSSITGNADINYEIAAKEEPGNTFSGSNINQTSVMPAMPSNSSQKRWPMISGSTVKLLR